MCFSELMAVFSELVTLFSELTACNSEHALPFSELTQYNSELALPFSELKLDFSELTAIPSNIKFTDAGGTAFLSPCPGRVGTEVPVPGVPVRAQPGVPLRYLNTPASPSYVSLASDKILSITSATVGMSSINPIVWPSAMTPLLTSPDWRRSW